MVADDYPEWIQFHEWDWFGVETRVNWSELMRIEWNSSQVELSRLHYTTVKWFVSSNIECWMVIEEIIPFWCSAEWFGIDSSHEIHSKGIWSLLSLQQVNTVLLDWDRIERDSSSTATGFDSVWIDGNWICSDRIWFKCCKEYSQIHSYSNIMGFEWIRYDRIRS